MSEECSASRQLQKALARVIRDALVQWLHPGFRHGAARSGEEESSTAFREKYWIPAKWAADAQSADGEPEALKKQNGGPGRNLCQRRPCG